MLNLLWEWIKALGRGIRDHVKNWLKKIKNWKKAKHENDLLNARTGEWIFSESTRRDRFYSAFVRDIVQNNRVNQRLKVVFFIFVCVVFAGVVYMGMETILTIARKDNIDYSQMGVAITALASVVSAIIVLPQIIANHLFPKDGEAARFNFITENQKFDTQSTQWEAEYEDEESENYPDEDEREEDEE